MRHLYLFYLLLMINGLHSQNFEWVKAFGGLGNQHINDIVIDSFDNVYVFGDFENTVDFNASPEETFNLTSIEGYNAFLAKYDSDGNFLWAEQIESSYLIDIDKVVISANSILVVGGFIGSVNFQTETETIALNSPSKNKMFLAKYNLDGNLQWVKYWGNSTAHIGARDVVIDSQNNIHICGHYGDGVLRPNTNSNTPAFSAIQDKGFWIEIDESGNYLDSKTFGDPNNSWYTYDRVQSIKFDDFGNSIITGNFRGSFDFDFSSEETIVQSHENGSNFIAKYHSTGSLLWVKNVDLIEPNDLQLDSNNDIYTTGKFYGTVDVDLSPNSEYILSAPVSYTHLTLPTNREV